jgi:hypothetical protein
MSIQLDAADAARQVKIARMIAALDADRAKNGHAWSDVRDLLDSVRNPVIEAAFFARVAVEAGTRPPSTVTAHLLRVHIDTLARCEADPFAGITAMRAEARR